jgi:signal transduction histidine kinase
MHHRRPDVATRIGAYMRARLRRRIFWWFGATIALTFVVAMGTMHLLGSGGNAWRRELSRGRALLEHSFERVWDVPAERDALARMIANDLDADITLRDRGETLLIVGRACERSALRASVHGTGEILVCPSRAREGGGARNALAFVVAGLVMWAMSGRIARRLARPFDQLASLAGELGSGRLGARLQEARCEDADAAIVGRVLNDMAARIEKQLADQRELLAAVSHEIRTPLSRIRLLTELGREKGAAEKAFDDIDREVVEIDGLVSELLASARLDFAAAKPIEVDAMDAAAHALERAGEPSSKLDAESSTVRTDATLLARALANLIENAKRHGGGLDLLRVRSEGDVVCFEALDRGPGFASGDELKVFESFYRGERTGEKPGLGLGLSLVRRIAEAHGGRAYAKNRDGGGAIVGISLPRA